MTNPVKRIAVIGSGIGGSAAAALLAARGHRVRLFERNEFTGGKCTGFMREGFHYDLGVHMFANGENGPLGRIAREVGANISWRYAHPLGIFTVGKTFPVPQEMSKLGNAYLLARNLGVKPGSYLSIARFINAMATATDEEAEERDHISIRDFMLRYTDDEQIHRFICGLGALAFVLPYQEASAGEFIFVMREMLASTSIGYPLGGASRVPRAYLAALEEHGGEVMLGNEVTEIVIDDGRAVGVIADAPYEADAVVSNAGIKLTVKLAGEKHFGGDYLDYVDSLTESAAGISIKYALSRKVLDYEMYRFMPPKKPVDAFDFLGDPHMVPAEPDIFMPVPSNFDAGLAPEGCQLAIAGTVASSDLSRADQCEKMLDSLDAHVRNMFPEIDQNLLFSIRTGTSSIAQVTGRQTGECIGIAQSYDQVGGRKLENRTPIENLYLVGADTGGRGIGTEVAANSALHCAAMIG